MIITRDEAVTSTYRWRHLTASMVLTACCLKRLINDAVEGGCVSSVIIQKSIERAWWRHVDTVVLECLWVRSQWQRRTLVPVYTIESKNTSAKCSLIYWKFRDRTYNICDIKSVIILGYRREHKLSLIRYPIIVKQSLPDRMIRW